MSKSHKYRDEILNTKFGMLTPVECVGNDPKSRRTLWKCRCDCGGEKTVRSDCLRQGDVKTCGCAHKRKGKDSPTWEGYEEISLSLWNRLKKGASERNYDFTVSIQEAWEIFLKQNRRCVLSGINLFFGTANDDSSQNASLDRIDSSKGYIQGNVQWLDKRVNFMKQALPQDEFIELCDKISGNYHSSK